MRILCAFLTLAVVGAAPFLYDEIGNVKDAPEHPDCHGSPKCPVWPNEFRAPFGLYNYLPPISNASSILYYKYTTDIQAQVIDYREKCNPFTSLSSFFTPSPCKLIFKPSGMYLSQPDRGVQCCRFDAGVKVTPPAFLSNFTLTGQNVVKTDLFNQAVSCDQWSADGSRGYWTVGMNDIVYGPTMWGHPIIYQDGPTGLNWRFGLFEAGPQPMNIFALPASEEECAQNCPVVIGEEATQALRDSAEARMVRGFSEAQAAAAPKRRHAGMQVIMDVIEAPRVVLESAVEFVAGV